MLNWWVLRCDDNHRWEALHDESRVLPAELRTCPVDGAPSVTLQKMAPADQVRISIVPAARVADEVTGALEHDERFVLEITSWQGGSALRSEKLLEWTEAVEQAGWFRGLSWNDASRRWKQSGLGGTRVTPPLPDGG